MSRYAEGTSVPVEKTRIEIEEVLRRFGADAVSSGYDGLRAFVVFRARKRMIRLTLSLPERNDKAFRLSATGKLRSETSAQGAYEAECRRRWRSLLLLLKAKVAAVADGITELEDEFMASVVLPDGGTVRDRIRPAIASAYDTGKTPPLLGGPGE